MESEGGLKILHLSSSMKVHDCRCDVNHAWCTHITQSVSALAWQAASRNQSRPRTAHLITSYIQTPWSLVLLHRAKQWLHAACEGANMRKIRKYCEIGSAALKLHTCICINIQIIVASIYLFIFMKMYNFAGLHLNIEDKKTI